MTINVKEEYKPIDFVEFSLPGKGESKENCGKIGYRVHYVLDSPGEFHYQKFQHDCGRFDCPVCPGWRKGEGKRIQERLKGFLAQTSRNIVHYVVSPEPQAVSTATQYKQLRKQMHKLAKKFGVRGGVAIFHYYRHPSPWNDKVEICPDQPHWHILGDGWIRPSDVPGWIVKNLGIRRTHAQIRSTINYILKWASKARGILPYGDLAIPDQPIKVPKIEIETWFGSMAYNVLKLQKIISEGIKCEVCGEMIRARDWYEIEFCNGKDPPEDHGSTIDLQVLWKFKQSFRVPSEFYQM